MKYRFYFEECTNQLNGFRVWWSTEAYVRTRLRYFIYL